MNGRDIGRLILTRRRPIFLALAALALTAVVVAATTFLASDFTPSSQVPLGTDTSSGFERLDSDSDGIPDIEESLRAGTNVLDPDSDADGTPDGWEARYSRPDPLTGRPLVDPLLADAGADPDKDNLTNRQEYLAETDPLRADSDGDGMDDGFEVLSGLKPLDGSDAETDPDADGLSNREEAALRTNPFKVDSDGDGLTDAEERAGEVTLIGQPLTFRPTDPARAETAGNGIPDGWAVYFGIDPHDPNAGFADPDGDGLANAEEYRASLTADAGDDRERLLRSSLSPVNRDTDGDGMDDGWEVRYVLDPLDASDAGGDPDSDGLPNLAEFKAGGDPRSRDSDGDGLTDDVEVAGWNITLKGKPQLVTSSPSVRDTDSDGLTDAEERNGRALVDGIERRFTPTNPRSPDTDFDGLTDAFETATPFGQGYLDPTVADTDDDGLVDGVEFDFWRARENELGTAGLAALRAERAERKLSPLDGAALAAIVGPEGDVDGDGVANILDADSDGDGDLADGAEWNPADRDAHPTPRTSPWLLDTDRDGLPDRWEQRYMRWDAGIPGWNLNPALEDSDADGTPDPQEDLDNDGVPAKQYRFVNLEELRRGTSPTSPDSDEDGIHDGWESYYAENHRAPLSPVVGTDATTGITRFPYSRLVNAKQATTAEAINATITLNASRGERYVAKARATDPMGDLFPDVTDDSGSPVTIVRVHGTFTFTYLDAFRTKADPSIDPATRKVRHDSDLDGMPDAWEAAFGLDPSAGDGDADYDGDGLTNLGEYVGIGADRRPADWDETLAAWGHGTDPRSPDTDFDSLLDGYEVENDLDPRNPYDAAGDLDGDGISNRDEGRLKTSARDVDSDNDGLLDGATLVLASNDLRTCMSVRCVELFRREGIFEELADTGGSGTFYRFYGESLRLGTQEFNLTPTNPDTDGDGMPDGWEVRYSRTTTDGSILDPSQPSFSNHDTDNLQDLAEYLLGRPEGWREGVDGVYWMGGNPTLADSDGDCEDPAGPGRPLCYDGSPDTDVGDRDYDNDGLDDFNGEDPFPFANPLNLAGRTPANASAMLRWITVDRFVSWQRGAADAGGVPYRRGLAPATVEVSAIHGLRLQDEAAVLLKGEPFVVEGNLTAPLGSTRAGVPNATVLVTPYGADETPLDVARRMDARDATLCAGFTNATGAFRITCSVTPSVSASVPNGSVLFGATNSTVSWTFNTKGVPTGPLRLHVWSYATNPAARPGDATYGNWSATSKTVGGSDRAFLAHGVTSASRDLATHRPLGTDGLPLILASASRIELTPETPIVTNETLRGTGRLVDGAGDPLADQDILLRWGTGADTRNLTVTTTPLGTFTFEFPVPDLASPRRVPLNATFGGTGLILNDTRELSLQVQFRTLLRPVEPPVLLAGDSVAFTGEVVDTRGAPIPGAPVAVELGDIRAEGLTGANGRYSIPVPVPDTTRAGPIEGKVRHLGSDRFLPSDAPVATIVKKPSLITLEEAVPQALLGSPLEIRGRVTDTTGVPVRALGVEELLIDVRVGGYSAQVPVTGSGPEAGMFRAVVPTDFIAGVGRFPLLLRFQESKLFAPSTNASEVSARSAVTILVEEARVPRNATVLLQGIVRDARGNPVPDHPVNLTFGPEAIPAATTDRSGSFAVPLTLPRAYPLGPVALKAVTPATDSYLRGERVASLSVISRTTLTLENAEAFTGPVTLEGQLLDDGGNAVPESAVQLAIEGVPVATVLTDRAGVFSEVYVIPATEAAGPRTLTATFAGGALLSESAAEATLLVLANTNLTITDLADLVRGEGARIGGAVTETSGRPAEGGEVSLRLGGREIGRTLVTGGLWVLNLRVPTDAVLGATDLDVVYEGTRALRESNLTVPVTVREKARIQFVELPKVATADATARVRLVDGRGEGVANTSLAVALGGHVFQVRTDNTGNASFPVVAYGNLTDRVPVEVRFGGDDSLTAASSLGTVALRLTPTDTAAASRAGALLGLAAVLALLAALGGFFLMRRRAARETREILAEAERQLVAGDEVRAVLYLTYGKLRATLAKQGYLEDKAETMREFLRGLERVLPVNPGALARLASLLELARYTDRPLNADVRRDALDILRIVQRELNQALGEDKPIARATGGAEA